MNFVIPEDNVAYLKELDEFIESTIRPLGTNEIMREIIGKSMGL